MKTMKNSILKAFVVTVVLLVICGLVYPLALTAAGQGLFSKQANGSIIEVDGKPVGSELIGQKLEGNQYLQGRVSSVNYNTYTKEAKDSGEYGGVSSGSFNYAPSSKDLEARVQQGIADFKAKYKKATGKDFEGKIPADLLTASGSGLDPHLSVEAAEVQIPIISANSGLTKEQVQKIIDDNTKTKLFGVFGEDTVNVLKCNLEIAKLTGQI